MRILFTADWHIKLGQKNVPMEWAINRYKSFYEQILELEKEVDIHIIGGDIFDRLPSLEELNLYFDYISKVNIPTYIYDGNHEATKKGKTFFTSLKEVSTGLNTKVTIVDDIFSTKNFSIVPYCKLHSKDWEYKLEKKLPLFTHVRGEIPPHVKPEIDLDRFNEFSVVFAGDLHSHSNCQRNIVYPGSPMTTSFHRSKVETGSVIIEEDLDWSRVRFKLPQLLKDTVTSQKEMIPTPYDHTIYELEGDLSDLSNIKQNDLLDKKIIIKSSDTALYLAKNMTIEEELIEYLSYILQLSEDKINNIISTYKEYNK